MHRGSQWRQQRTGWAVVALTVMCSGCGQFGFDPTDAALVDAALADGRVDVDRLDGGRDSAARDTGPDAPAVMTDAGDSSSPDAPAVMTDAGDDAPSDAGNDAGNCTAIDGPFGCLAVTQALHVGGPTTATATLGTGDWLSDTVTIEAWVRSDGTNNSVHMLVARRRVGAGGYEGILFGLYNGQLFAQLSDTPNHLSGTPSALASGAWVHVALTYGAGRVTFYENGVEVGSAASSRTIRGDIPGFLGRDSVSAASKFDGWMHHVRIWGAVRSPEELAHGMYNEIAGDAPDLLAEYTMQQPTGQLVDSTGRHSGNLGSTAGVDSDDAVREPI